MASQFPLRAYVAGGWMVQLPEREVGPYFSRRLAIRVAIDDAWWRARRGRLAPQRETNEPALAEAQALKPWPRLRSDRFGF